MVKRTRGRSRGAPFNSARYGMSCIALLVKGWIPVASAHCITKSNGHPEQRGPGWRTFLRQAQDRFQHPATKGVHATESRWCSSGRKRGNHCSFARTSSLIRFPSTGAPANFAMVAFITGPMSFNVLAPVSCITASITCNSSSSDRADGR